MNYNSILDPFFSSGWISFGTLLGLLALGLIFRKPLFINRKQKGLLGTLYFAFFMLGLFTILLINPIYWGYGKAIGVKSVLFAADELYVMDYRLAGGGEGDDPEPYYRVQKIDSKTGEKQFRFIVGRASDLVLISTDAIVCRRINELVFYSVEDGHEIAVWNEETLPGIFTELASGVDNFNSSSSDGLLNLTSKDGRSWRLNLASRKIETNTERVVSPDLPVLEIDGDEIEKNGQGILILKNPDYNDKRKQMYLRNDSLANKDFFFIEGEFIGIDEKNNSAIILHYETTSKSRFILTAVSFDGKERKWDLKQSALRTGDDEIPLETCYTADEKAGIFYFAMQDEMIAVQMKDGKILWRQAL